LHSSAFVAMSTAKSTRPAMCYLAQGSNESRRRSS
jgi:hypothetical protein